VLALMSEELEILGITTVFGTIEAEQAAQNALHVLELLGWEEIPVRSGSPKALLPNLNAETGRPILPEFPGKAVHGPQGFGSYKVPRSSRNVPQNAVQWLADRVVNSPKPIELVAIGPLTNIALATLIEPRFAENVKQLIFMGGVTDGPGNVRPLATANIWNDPEAAFIVFHAGFNEIVMVGQDVTRYARVTEIHKNRLRNIDTQASRLLLSVSDIYEDMYAKREPNLPGYPVHDVLAVYYLLDPGAFQTVKLHVTVETHGRATRGQTVADKRAYSSLIKQIYLCVKVDADRVFKGYFDRISANKGSRR